MLATALAILFGPGIASLAKTVLIIAGIFAVVYVILKAMGVKIPDWFVTILLIIVLVVVGIWAVDLIAGL